jgi:hypothetical protein
MARRVGDADARRSRAHAFRVEPAHGFGARARRVFGDVHDAQALCDRERDRLDRLTHEKVLVPPFGVLADRRRADEQTGFDGNAGGLRHPRDRLDVANHRARRAIRFDPELRVGDLPGQRQYVGFRAGAGSRQSDVRRVDPELVHEMEQLALTFDLRIGDRR